MLFGLLVKEIGVDAIAAAFARLGWRWLIILWYPFAIVCVFDTLGWRFAFRRDTVPFPVLFAVRLAGEAVNATTPTAQVGGEGVKTWLLLGRVPLAESLPSVIVAKTTITVAQGLFLLAGAVTAGLLLPWDSDLLKAMWAMLVVEVLAVGGFVAVQVAGVVANGGRLLGRLWTSVAQALATVDGELVRFYRGHPGRLALSTLCHFVGWLLGAYEAYVVLRFLRIDVSLTQCLTIEAFSSAVRFATFLVPAGIGVQEGGTVAAFVALGLEANLGLSLSLIRRIRTALWAGLGFLLMPALRDRRSVPAAYPAKG